MIFNLGSINIDHVYLTPHTVAPGETLSSHGYQRVLGGKGANQSIAVARAGAAVCHIGAINASDSDIIEQLAQDGINTTGIHFSELATGHAIIQVTDDGENAIVLFAGANHDITNSSLEKQLVNAQPGDWLLAQNETNHIQPALVLAKQQGLKVAFNPAPMTAAIKNIDPALVDLLIVNEIESEQLTGSANIAKALSFFQQNWPTTEVIITQGSQGVVHSYKGQTTELSAFSVDVVDTTAAGDTFVGYFLAQKSQNKSTSDALINACKAAALTVTQLGASSSIPTLSAVKAFQPK